jgi:hypothetical protein
MLAYIDQDQLYDQIDNNCDRLNHRLKKQTILFNL